MPTVQDFSEAELWYIYEALTTATFVGATQQEIWEIFNGTNPQGLAISLFNQLNGLGIADQLSETLSGGDTPIANLLIETLSGNTKSISNVCYDSYLELSSVNSNLQNIDTNTTNTSNYLSTIRTPVIISTSASATISGQLHNISFYNSGSSAGTITVNGTTVNLPVGVTINYDAGGNNNRFPTNVFSYNATGTTFLISYVN